MSAMSVEVPYPVFTARDGEPLEDGYVWIGVVNLNPQTNPVQVYFDRNLTQPAAQPLRTINGYISNAGTPSQIYIDGNNYSILVHNKKGTMVYSFPDGTGIAPPPNDACGLAYTPPFTNSVSTFVCNKLAETVSVKDFGAVGDGVTDDSDALEVAFNRSNAIVDGGGATYKVTRNLTQFAVNNLKIQNLNIDSSSVTTGNPILMFAGVRGSSIPVTANIARNATTITMASTAGLYATQYLFVGSDAFFSAGQNSKIGQIVKIFSVDSGTQVTLSDPIHYPFSTSDNAYVQPLTTAKNITLDNVSMTGNPTSTVLGFAVRAEVCENFTATNCTFRQYNYAAIRADRSVNTYILNCRAYESLGLGLAYGFVMAFGCYNFVVDGCYGENLRHLVTTGGSDGVNLYVKAINNTVMEAWDSGLDCHCNTDQINYSNNHIQISDRVRKEGIIIQGGNAVCVGNVIKNALRGIYYQSLTDNETVSLVISDNVINLDGNAGEGIHVTTMPSYSTQVNSLAITGNTINGSGSLSHITIYARGANIFNTSVTGNVCEFFATDRSLYVRALDGQKIDRLAITGNVFKAGPTEEVVWFFGDTTSSINDVAVTGNVIVGGRYGIYGQYANDVITNGNKIVDYSIAETFFINSSNSYSTDYSEGTWTPVVTASTTNPTNITYTAQYGKWIKNGKTVTVFCTLRFSADDAGVGYPIITGLPFTEATSDLPGVSVGFVSALTDQNVTGYVSGTSVLFTTTTYIGPVTNDYVSFTATYQIS